MSSSADRTPSRSTTSARRADQEKQLLIDISLGGEVTKIEFNPFNDEEFIAMLDDYFVKIKTNKEYDCFFFGQWDYQQKVLRLQL